MQKNIYLIRHCEAKGQSAESSLTAKGFEQAEQLSDFFADRKIDRILSSPYLRAVQSIEPLSKRVQIKTEIDERLSERILSTNDLPDWFEKLKETFTNPELRFEGGESSQEAVKRILAVVEYVCKSKAKNIIIVSHGNIISLLLRSYDNSFDFECWRNLSNPDVFQIKLASTEATVKRIWDTDTL